MKKKFVTIGHIVNDIEPSDHLGGGVSYSAIAAQKLGYDSYIITKCPKTSPYLRLLSTLGVTVIVLPSQSPEITTFENLYDKNGSRRQRVVAMQEAITLSDFHAFPVDILQDAVIMVAVIIGEVETSLYEPLSQFGSLHVCPQGYFRKIENDGTVVHKQWTGFEKDSKHVKSMIFSKEDITFNNHFDEHLLQQFKNLVPITILTTGELGSLIYKGEETIQTTSLQLLNTEFRDFTGAGDVYAAVFALEFNRTNNLLIASVTATFYASLKIIGFSGIGIDSIPTIDQIKQFIKNNPSRYEEFLRMNNVEGLPLFT